jgi:hypothetical protein
VSESVPVPGAPTLVQRAAKRLLALAGWSVNLPWPPEPRGIILVYPHTSNWDFVVGILVLLSTGLPAQWVGKDTLFRWPFGGLLQPLGGIPVNRREHTGFIEQLAAEFRCRSWMWLALAPEGTRRGELHARSSVVVIVVARAAIRIRHVEHQIVARRPEGRPRDDASIPDAAPRVIAHATPSSRATTRSPPRRRDSAPDRCGPPDSPRRTRPA